MQAYNSLGVSFSGPGRTRKGAALTVSAHFLKTAVLLVILGLCMNADAQETALGLILKGNQQYAAGAYLAALSLYDRALRIEPTNATAWSNRGACLLDLGRHNEALASLEKALTIEHGCSTYRLKSFALRKLGRVSEAEACDAKAVQIENELKEAATEAYLSGLYDDAITKINVLLRNEVRDATVWNLAGVSTVGKGRHLEALKYYDYALKFSPRDDVILVNKAKCLLTLDRCEDALAVLKVATTANPHSVLAWDTVAEVHSRLGQGEAAGQATRRANRIRRWGAHTLRWAIGIATGVGACLAAVLLIALVYVAHGWLSHLALCYELKHGYLAQARHEAARLLRASGNPSDIRTLIKALRDSQVRTTAMSALRTLGPGWLPFLRESLKSERCDSARGAIQQIIAAIEEQTGDVMSESEPCLQTSRRAATGSRESPPSLGKQLFDARSRSDRPLKAAAARSADPAPQTSDEATSPPGRIAELRRKLGLSERKVRPTFDSARSLSGRQVMDDGTEKGTSAEAVGKLVMELDQKGLDPDRSLTIVCVGCAKRLGLFFSLGDVYIRQDAGSTCATHNAENFQCSDCGSTRLNVSQENRPMSERLHEDLQSLVTAPFEVKDGFTDRDVQRLHASAHDCRFLDFDGNTDLLVRAVSPWLQWSGYNASATIDAAESCTHGPISIPKCPVIRCYSQRLGEQVWIVKSQNGSLWVCDPNMPDETAMLERWRVLLSAVDERP